MGTAGDLLLSLAGVAVVLAAPLEVAFGALIAFWLLVPGNLSVPHLPHLLLVHRLLLYAFVVRLLVRRGDGEPRASAYALTPIHWALGALLLVGFADGVVLAPASDSLAGDLHSWLTLLDLLVLFVVVLAVVRTITPRRAVNIVVPVVLVAVGIGLLERLSGHGWSHFFFEGLPVSYYAPGANALQVRGGHVRSQGAAQFALEYGWVLAMLLPLVIYAVLRWATGRRRWTRLAVLLPLAAIAAVIFSGSRVAEIGAVVVALLLVIVAGADRRLFSWGLGLAAIGVIVTIADPSFVTSPFSTLSTTDPASVRLDRLPPLFALVVHRPFTGLGFTGISSIFGGLDDAYALVYSTLGVLGVLAWLALIAIAAITTARALRARRGSHERTLGAACLLGIIAVGMGAALYDLVDTPQSTWALIVLAAIGAAVAETVPRRARSRRWLARLLLPIAGVGVGFAVLAAAPVSASQSLSIFTVAPWVVALQGPVYSWKGAELVDTFCPTVTSPDVIAPGTSVSCVQGSNIFPTDYAGLALVTARGPTASAVRAEIKRALTPIFRYMPIEGGATETIQTGKPSWAETAPVSGGVIGLICMLFLPPLFRSRRRSVQARVESREPVEPVEPLVLTGVGA